MKELIDILLRYAIKWNGRNPNPDQTWGELIDVLTKTQMICGSCFVWEYRDSSGEVTVLYSLNPMDVVYYEENGKPHYRINQSPVHFVGIPFDHILTTAKREKLNASRF